MLNLSDSIKTSRPDEVRINCPHCQSRGHGQDTKYKMYVNTKKGVVHCFRCGYSKNNINKNGDALEAILDSSVLDKLGDDLDGLFSIKAIQSYDMDSISWKLDKYKTPIAYNYIVGRGFSDREIEKYDLRVGKDYVDEDGKTVRKWSGRILFPYKNQDDKILFVVGRSYCGKEPKYINSSGDRSHAVYGLNDVVDGVAAACEGIIDAIAFKKATGIPGVCGLGKEYTDYQIQKIASKCHTIYESLDGDVDGNIRFKLCMGFVKNGVNVKNLNLPHGEDPDSYSLKLNDAIRKATNFNPSDFIFKNITLG